MPLPADMQARLSDPDFWRAYFFDADADLDDRFVDGAGLTAEDGDDVMSVEFPVGAGFALVLDIDVELRMVTLEMRSPAHPDTLQLGWDDDAHRHPHALRWDELDLIARAAAVHDPALRHPGPVVALASRFVVLDHRDDLDAITPLVDAAFGPPPPAEDPPAAGRWPTARDWLRRADGRRDGVTWQRHDTGDWTVTQDGDGDRFTLYSIRHPGGGFPFADWRALIAAAEATVGRPRATGG